MRRLSGKAKRDCFGVFNNYALLVLVDLHTVTLYQSRNSNANVFRCLDTWKHMKILCTSGCMVELATLWLMGIVLTADPPPLQLILLSKTQKVYNLNLDVLLAYNKLLESKCFKSEVVSVLSMFFSSSMQWPMKFLWLIWGLHWRFYISTGSVRTLIEFSASLYRLPYKVRNSSRSFRPSTESSSAQG